MQAWTTSIKNEGYSSYVMKSQVVRFIDNSLGGQVQCQGYRSFNTYIVISCHQ